MKDELFLTAAGVADRLGVSVQTLTNWYKWYRDDTMTKPEDTPTLPQYWQEHSRGKRLWESADLPKLEEFKNWVGRGRGGKLGEFNRRMWGKRNPDLKKNI